ncbi:GYDIA family GHMP kinase [Ornithobacterium rhinotracheale]
MAKNTFCAHGKLLLTAEYVVLDGAKALCLPTQIGQNLEVSPLGETSNFFEWTAILKNGKIWFSEKYVQKPDEIVFFPDSKKSKEGVFLLKILNEILALNPSVQFQNLSFKTQLEFNKDWGVGSSSTLIALLAQFAEVNAYELLEKTFGGSGYDLACALAKQPIFYTRNGVQPKIEIVDFSPTFKNQLFFVYLNQKQNSREGIAMYRQKPKNADLIQAISQISEKVALAQDLESFNQLLEKHESLISRQIKMPCVQEKLFPDYTQGIVKSLGAWGGDFVLVSSKNADLDYFKQKGYHTILPYSDLIL